jgi:hypothetical protein
MSHEIGVVCFYAVLVALVFAACVAPWVGW